MGYEVLFDASRLPTFDLTFMLVFAAGCMVVGGAGFFVKDVKLVAASPDPSLFRAGALVFALAGLALLISCGRIVWSASAAQQALRSSHVIEGCVQDLRPHIIERSELIGIDFAIGRNAFHFDRSPFVPGFHDLERIHANQNLRITQGPHSVLRIESAKDPCPV